MPYKDTGHLLNAQKNYNRKLSQIRVIIEQAFGMLKGRFRRLKHIVVRDVENIVNIVVACCVLHNICILNKDELNECIEEPDNVDNRNTTEFLHPDAQGEHKRRYRSITNLLQA